jgi:hypothetical protein
MGEMFGQKPHSFLTDRVTEFQVDAAAWMAVVLQRGQAAAHSDGEPEGTQNIYW